ncbi:hypothetical protein FNV43_RR13134 [Rhamnella rubrinervis]|uniref:Uncharacterized protein n=1 Tax=Rhamnella rubrinervis TaxID=2594499 RepID=A0A8K0MER8_9ROSA|nr:hypothetical protein FNV43_RR13134 [Rhamnella rubrinervis]
MNITTPLKVISNLLLDRKHHMLEGYRCLIDEQSEALEVQGGEEVLARKSAMETNERAHTRHSKRLRMGLTCRYLAGLWGRVRGRRDSCFWRLTPPAVGLLPMAGFWEQRTVASHLKGEKSQILIGAEMLQKFDGMFAQSTSSLRQAAMNGLMNTRLTGENVRDHYLKMMSYFTQLEVMRTKLDQQAQLMHELESAERALVKRGSAHNVEGSSSKSKGGQKNKKKNKAKISVTKTIAMKRRQVECGRSGSNSIACREKDKED